jgi:putative heme-binding domain-containing protein
LQERYASPHADAEKANAVRQLLWSRMMTVQQSSARLDVLWTCHALTAISDQEALELTSHEDENVRAWAIQLTLEDNIISEPVRSRLVQLAKSEDSWRVRLYLASGLQRLELSERWDLAAALVAHGDSQYDANLPLVLWYGIEPLVAEDTPRAMKFASAAQIPLVRQFVYRRAAVDPALVESLVSVLADSQDENAQTLMVSELRGAAEKLGRIPMPKRWPEVVQKLATSKQDVVRQAVQFLSISFGDRSLFPTLRGVVADQTAAPAMRTQAFAALLQGKDDQLADMAIGLLDDPALQKQSLAALAQSDSPKAAPELIARIEKWPADLKGLAAETLVSRPASASLLLAAVQEGRLPRGTITALHVSKIQSLGDASLLEKLNQFWGTIRATPEETLQQIAALKKANGPQKLAALDRSQGRELFAKSCGTCHRLFGEGSEVGPDLTGANRSNIDYLLENILDPNAVVGKDYQTVTVLTADGRVVSGLIREDTAAALVIHDAQKLVTIPRAEIEQISPTKRSLMPEGLLKPLEPEQIGMLLAYLQSTSQVPLPGQGPLFNPETGRVPGALEAEKLAVKATGGRTQVQSMGNFKADRWSGSEHVWWVDGKPGDRLEMVFDVAAAGEYEIFTVLTKAHDYGQFSLSVDGKVAIPQIDLFDKAAVITTGPVSLGTHSLSPGKHRVEVQLLGANPLATPRYMFGIDYLYLAKPVSK